MYIVPEVVQAVEMVLGLLLPGTVYAFLPAYAQFSSKPGGARIRRSQDQEELGSGGARTRRSQDQEELGSGGARIRRSQDQEEPGSGGARIRRS